MDSEREDHTVAVMRQLGCHLRKKKKNSSLGLVGRVLSWEIVRSGNPERNINNSEVKV